jgi:hypothetical protein
LSQEQKIAVLLTSMIADRTNLTIGTINAAVTAGNRGLFSTSIGALSAEATNFCYGDCLLAKVEGKWYAVNPTDNRQVIKTVIDRQIQRKPKGSALPLISVYVGIKTDDGGGGGTGG